MIMGSESKIDNNMDDHVDEEIYSCLNPEQPKSFFLFAGAGSGKTRSLVNVLERFKEQYGMNYRLYRQRIAIVTYTNAAADEIKRRLKFDRIFEVSTIHSFSWELIKYYTQDIKCWLKENLQSDLFDLQEQQMKSRDPNNKTSLDRARKIESKEKRLLNLDQIREFRYNPNGDNLTKDSLNHAEVISIAANFIETKPLMQDIVSSIFPVIFVDESQDTKKEMISALFVLQNNKKENFLLGLFGDMMQRIYSDGKEKLDQGLPPDWKQPVKKMNHRSNRRIIKLINDIRKEVDKQKQFPRTEKEEGIVRFFISGRNADKANVEAKVFARMAEITEDGLWKTEVKSLILEHHMAANRMGFFNLFEPLYRTDSLKTGLLDGTLGGLTLFTKTILPLLESHRKNDQFSIARIIKAQSKLLKRDVLLNNQEQLQSLKLVHKAVLDVLKLWDEDNDPKLLEIIEKVHQNQLFELPNALNIIASRKSNCKVDSPVNEEEEENDSDEIIEAWDQALQTPFSQLEKYNDYLSENSKFGTHQGVKGLEYPRVAVIIDDEEARGFLFTYDKLFGAKSLSNTDRDNIRDGRDSVLDRTRRLFYVACSRAKESLAIIAYTSDPESVKATLLANDWFEAGEIEII
jgi:DNA helicase-2/ATP-dependent DNA helicase PcrA